MQLSRPSQLRAEPYLGGQSHPSADKPQKRLPVSVRFFVEADSLEEARDRVRQVIEHGKEAHDPALEWEWSVGS